MYIKTLLISVILTLGLSANLNAEDPIYTGTFSKLAVGGFDTTSYFAGEGKPVKGSKEFTHVWRGAEWRFASADNLKKFQAAPEKFAPQYGGYCAWAVSQDKLAKGDPKIYALVDGKLFLNYNKKIAERWEGQRDTFIKQANVHYPTLVDLEK